MKIAIIGAGVLGISTAYFLKEAGHEVTIIERHSQAGLETSFANAGLLTPSLSDPWNSPGIFWKLLTHIGRNDTPILIRLNALASLGTWGLQFLKYASQEHYYQNIKRNAALGNLTNNLITQLIEKCGIQCDYKPSGTLMIFRDQKSLDHAKSLADYMTQLAIPYAALSQLATLEKEPALATIKNDIVGGFFYPSDAMGDAHQFTQALANYLERQGVKFRYETKALLVKNNKKVDLVFNGAKYDVDGIILAGGVNSLEVAKSIGIKLPIRPCKGYSITFSGENWTVAPKIPVIDHTLHAVVTPYNKRIRVAGTAEFAGFNKKISEDRIQNLFHVLQKIYPKGYEQTIPSEVSRWTGLRPTCVDGAPILGPTKYENLFLNTGHGHLGWTMGLGSGKLLSDFLSGTPSPISIDEYSLARFD